MARIATNRRRRRVGSQAWRVIETYDCPTSEADGHEAELWERIPEGFSGRSAPTCQDVAIRYRGLTTGRAEIVAVFETPTWDEYLLRYPNKFVLFASGALSGQTVKTDLDGYTINGIDLADPTGRTIWKIIQGANTRFRPNVVYIVRGVVTDRSIWFDQYTDHLGDLNANSCSHFGRHQQPGELMLATLAMAPHPRENDRWTITYHFMGRNGGWNNDTVAQKHLIRAVDVPKFDLTTGADSTTETAVVRVNVPTTETRIARLFETTNLFGLLNNEIQW